MGVREARAPQFAWAMKRINTVPTSEERSRSTLTAGCCCWLASAWAGGPARASARQLQCSGTLDVEVRSSFEKGLKRWRCRDRLSDQLTGRRAVDWLAVGLRAAGPKARREP
jgi:hypothetical protein